MESPTGLREATINLITSTSVTPSVKAAPNAVKALADSAPSSRTHLGPIREGPDSPEAITDQERSAVATSFWSKIWAERKGSASLADRSAFLSSYNKSVDTELLAVPSLVEVLAAIHHTNNSSAGPDGISFAAWRAAPELAAPILLRVFRALCSGQPPPPGFNLGLLFLLPKKHTGLVSDTRPLSVTNTDNRILASLTARAIMPAVLELVDPAQKGFLNGRSGSEHTVEINTYFYTGVEEKLDRLLFLLDTAKAFDSIDHAWIHQVLEHTKFPSWFRFFVRGALNDVKVSPFFGGATFNLIDIKRGVKQGCPLSPLLFILAYDPLLHALSSVPHISNFAFADDLAITTSSVALIYPALRCIDSFSFVSGLGVNREKSLVLSTSPPHKLALIRDGLAKSPWPDLPLKDKGTHLGVVIGRLATLDDIWATPMSRALDRIKKVTPFMKTLSLSNRIIYVNVFIVSIFSYIGLYFVLPTLLWKTIKNAISKLIIPFNGGAFTYNSLICSNAVFGLKPTLKDVWAFTSSLLAARSPLISTNTNYNLLPSINLTFTKLITRHRDAAAVDFWRGRHMPDGTLLPLSSPSSSCIYKAILFDL